MLKEKVLEVSNLEKYFNIKSRSLFGSKKYVHAVDGVSFDLLKGETLGIVGESGSGKSTLARTVLNLTRPTGGKIMYQGRDITHVRGRELREVSNSMQMIFQDPYASLNPKLKIGSALCEAMQVHGIVSSKKEAQKRVLSLLDLVGLQAEAVDRYPHEFSGGQRQRIGIARALAIEPEVLFCDESVSALDVSVQAQILNLFNELKNELNLTYVFIAHDLAVVRYISDRILVMYLGKIMEVASYEEIFGDNNHPYTESLRSAILEPTTEAKQERIILEGDLPSPISPPSGCRFCTRCFKAEAICSELEPDLIWTSESQAIRCHFAKVKKGPAK
ncbi:MAG: ATP-binding cassette domain-containing protein [Fastidiosipila sp.]|nr:ATP-binding cassette domain-containing protein [Fastidiosipila sp.]